ncbi:hypothetical protein EV368DRAFT_63723 [Lentinula lateritia]|nr:hypothetical protein EV368DRAFT_63723 [Lentinula lateritia]
MWKIQNFIKSVCMNTGLLQASSYMSEVDANFLLVIRTARLEDRHLQTHNWRMLQHVIYLRLDGSAIIPWDTVAHSIKSSATTQSPRGFHGYIIKFGKRDKDWLNADVRNLRLTVVTIVVILKLQYKEMSFPTPSGGMQNDFRKIVVGKQNGVKPRVLYITKQSYNLCTSIGPESARRKIQKFEAFSCTDNVGNSLPTPFFVFCDCMIAQPETPQIATIYKTSRNGNNATTRGQYFLSRTVGF